MSTQFQSFSRFSPRSSLSFGTDAVILLGASCGGPEEYASIADELGYGRLPLPRQCDTESIRNQLLRNPGRWQRQGQSIEST